jgi:hypothetical protein
LKKIFVYLKTVYKLGFLNVLSVLYYRIFTHSLLTKIYFPQKVYKELNLVFLPSTNRKSISENQRIRIIECADSILEGNVYYYSHRKQYVGEKPVWFLNPFNKATFNGFRKHWSKLNDFNSGIGDIKNIWEISRFNWLGTLVQAHAITLDEKYLERLNFWLSDWFKENQTNTGPNWKCAQEASIRVLNLILAQEILNPNTVTNDLKDYIEIHIDRITPTTFYAKAQNNNHGLSEGCALFLAGYFLWKNKKEKKYYSAYKKGLKLVEDQVQELILDDGTFSQYSIVYHRMILDLLSVIELLRQEWNLDSFSESFYEKVNLAIEWYSSMIDPISGSAPNMGANDGTYLFNYDQKEYRDFRPTLLLASALYNKPIPENLVTSHNLFQMFKTPSIQVEKKAPKSKIFSQGGYLKLVRKDGMALLRAPEYRFRPSHADALHIDIWQDGINWIRDAGSFSYALNSHELDAFSGTQGHSTIQFDNRNQMPRLSRFLFGDWLTPSHLEFSKSDNRMSVAYTSAKNNYHSRSVNKIKKGWEIQDEISGKFKIAVLRWILNPSDWAIKGDTISNGKITLNISSNHNVSLKLKNGFESLYYMSKASVPILEIECSTGCSINTNVSFAA